MRGDLLGEPGVEPQLDDLDQARVSLLQTTDRLVDGRDPVRIRSTVRSTTESGTRARPAPCLTRPLARACSIRMHHIASPAARWNCLRSEYSSSAPRPVSFRNAAWTSAVASSVWPGSCSAILLRAIVRSFVDEHE